MIKLNEGEKFGHFKIVKFLGSGAFKSVYKAHLEGKPEDEFLALAVPHDQSRNERSAQLKEFEFVRKLNHPAIVRMFDVHEIEDVFFVSMEYVEGFTLDKILRERGRISPAEAGEYAIKVADSLKHAHDRNIGHRDVKPGNIIRTSKGHIKLLDFGLARWVSKDLTQTAHSVGTIQYVAPEVFTGSTGKKVDIWAMGVMLYELVFGEFPFKGESLPQLIKTVCEGTFVFPPEADIDIPDAYEHIILKCLEKDPAKRYDINELLNALKAFHKHGLVIEGFEGKLELFFRSRLSFIYIVSYEEDRVLSCIEKVSQKISRGMKRRPVLSWSISQGLLNPEGKPVTENTNDPFNMLNIFSKLPENSIVVLKDFHSFLQNPVIARRFKDLLPHMKQTGKTILFVSPTDNVPGELEKLIQVHNFPLPDQHQLERLFTGLIRENKIENRLRFSGPERERFIRSALGLTYNEAEAGFARVIIEEKGELSGDSIQKVLDEKKQILRRAKILEFFSTEEDFSNVGGLKTLKKWFNSRAAAFNEDARNFGLPYPRGILLIGVPGCGKSLSAKAVASEWRAPLLKLDVGKLFTAMVGQSERNLERAVATAETIAPCILWLDEIEKGFGGLAHDSTGVAIRLFGNFITWLNEKKSPVFVVATANRVVAKDAKGGFLPLLPPELMRKGRIDEIFFLDLPNFEERKEILRIHLEKVEQTLSDDELTVVSRSAEGFSGAEIEFSVIASLFSMFAEKKRNMEMKHILSALSDTVSLSKTRKEEINLIRQWAAENARPAR